MTDRQKCKSLLDGGGYTCALVLGEKTVVSEKRGISPLIEFINDGTDYRGYSAADRIVGKAAALLYVALGVSYVYAQVLSETGKRVLGTHGVAYDYGVTTEKIINRRGDDICPMERAVQGIDDPSAAVTAIVQKLNELRAD